MQFSHENTYLDFRTKECDTRKFLRWSFVQWQKLDLKKKTTTFNFISKRHSARKSPVGFTDLPAVKVASVLFPGTTGVSLFSLQKQTTWNLTRLGRRAWAPWWASTGLSERIVWRESSGSCRAQTGLPSRPQRLCRLMSCPAAARKTS